MFQDAFSGGARVPALADLLASLSQQDRLLRVDTALPQASFVAEQAQISESVNAPFEIELTVLATSAYFELRHLLGEQITLQLKRPDGRYRPWHGYVLQAAQLGADGGLARYRLSMRPWLSLLDSRHDSFTYQDKTALQIVEDVFRDHPQANWRVEVTEPLRQRSLCSQYRESDLAFVQRLLAEEGLSYHFEHLSGDAAASADRAGQARHCLVITDRHAPRPSAGPLRYATPRDSASPWDAARVDTFTRFAAQRQAITNAATVGSWDYKRLAGVSGSDSAPQPGLPSLELYDGAGAYRYESTDHAQRAATLALQACEQQVLRFEAQGSVRSLAAGSTFSLQEHPRLDADYTALQLRLEAVNNLGAQAARLLQRQDLDKGQCRARVLAQPAATPVVPGFHRKPSAPGVQTALVVGLENEPLTTERDLRVKLQFPWQRGRQPNPGGLPHDERSPDTQGNAPGTEASGTWVRVAQPAAGANFGSVFVPRIGTEVLVDFIEADIDRPLIVGQLHNGQDTPPFAAGVNAGTNHPGVISGVHSPSLDRSGYNEWTIDDATGQLRMRLLTSYAMSEFGLGHLIQQTPANAQRGPARGAGFELTTQAWGSLRAGQGLLISTSARTGTYGSAQSTQMDAAESVQQLKGAHDLAQRLNDAARTMRAQALKSHEASQSIEQLIQGLDRQQDGKYEAPVNGQPAKKEDASRQPTEPVERPAKPTLTLDTPSTLAQITGAGIAAFSGQDSSWITQGDWQETAAHTFSLVAGRTASWYAHDNGIQVKAANGPVSLQAHTDRLEILADQDVQVLSVNDEIVISAQKKIELVGGDSSITLEGGDITFKTPGSFVVKAAMHDWNSAGGGEASLPNLPAPEKVRHWVELNYRDVEAVPMAGAPYTLRFANGVEISGQLDAKGHARVEGVPPEPYTVRYGESGEAPRPRRQSPANPLFGKGLPKNREEAQERLAQFMAAEEGYLRENYFPDEIAAMQGADGTVSLALDRYADDYTMTTEQTESIAQLDYRTEHPEGKETGA